MHRLLKGGRRPDEAYEVVCRKREVHPKNEQTQVVKFGAGQRPRDHVLSNEGDLGGGIWGQKEDNTQRLESEPQ